MVRAGILTVIVMDGRCGMSLQGKRIVVGVTGGIAAYKAAELVRLLGAAGAAVQVAMTPAATGFVGPLTFQALTGRPVALDEPVANGHGMAHIDLGRQCDAMLIAPASADFLARLAQGLAGDVLSAACLARDCPLFVAPAMNRQMWRNPATQRNVRVLEQDGVRCFGPQNGIQACGEDGPGRMMEPVQLVQALEAALATHVPEAGSTPQVLAGVRVLVTAGPTLERLDPVRALTNLSSGRMGYAVAQAAAEAGAQVVLVSGPTCLATPAGVERVDVESAAQMLSAVEARVAGMQVFIAVAAVSDYRPARTQTEKIKKSAAPLRLELLPNEDILGRIAAREQPPFCVGFAAETEHALEYGEAKRCAKRVPLMAVNLAQVALGSEDNELTLLDERGAHALGRADKLVLARRLVAHLAGMLNRPGQGAQPHETSD